MARRSVPVSMLGFADSLACRSPERVAQVHPLLFEVLFRVPSLAPPAHSLSGSGFLPGFRPSRDVTGCVHFLEESQLLDMFRPQVFSTSRRLSPRLGSTGLFHPAAASREFQLVQGLDPLRAATTSSSEASSPLPLLSSRSPAQVWRPRLLTSASRPSSAAELARQRVGS